MSEFTKIDKALELIAKLSIDKSSNVLSKMIKSGAKIELEDVYFTDISDVTAKIMTRENKVVGAFIDLVGDAPFSFLFYVDVNDSLILTDLILKKEIGSNKEFNALTSSAVQELGNVIASAITNVFVGDFQIAMRPSPPIVVHDFESTVFQEYLMSSASESDEILLIESLFRVIKNDIKCRMFILPVGGSEKVLSYIASSI